MFNKHERFPIGPGQFVTRYTVEPVELPFGITKELDFEPYPGAIVISDLERSYRKLISRDNIPNPKLDSHASALIERFKTDQILWHIANSSDLEEPYIVISDISGNMRPDIQVLYPQISSAIIETPFWQAQAHESNLSPHEWFTVQLSIINLLRLNENKYKEKSFTTPTHNIEPLRILSNQEDLKDEFTEGSLNLIEVFNNLSQKIKYYNSKSEKGILSVLRRTVISEMLPAIGYDFSFIVGNEDATNKYKTLIEDLNNTQGWYQRSNIKDKINKLFEENELDMYLTKEGIEFLKSPESECLTGINRVGPATIDYLKLGLG